MRQAIQFNSSLLYQLIYISFDKHINIANGKILLWYSVDKIYTYIQRGKVKLKYLQELDYDRISI